MCRDFRKPLIIMTPKSLLRHKLAVSPKADFLKDSTFHRVLWDSDHDNLARPKGIKRIVFCTGKVYYDLLEERRKRELDDVMLVRIEQLYPFPHKTLVKDFADYKHAEFIWCQEEPRNMGSWTFVREPFEAVMAEIGAEIGPKGGPRYVGRAAAASPASGLLRHHNEEQARLVDEALSV
jgi:2-oxoglutarate dehydrogenase E1 component